MKSTIFNLTCPQCQGEGSITVAGTSHNPNCGFATYDPQEAQDVPCDVCRGTGEINPKENQ